MDARVNFIMDEVLNLHYHENGDCQEHDDRNSDRSRGGSELLRSASVSNQNAHAFRPNSIAAKMKVSRS